jgi:hypothetical protein
MRGLTAIVVGCVASGWGLPIKFNPPPVNRVHAAVRRCAIILAALCLVFSCVTFSYAAAITVTADPLWTNTGILLTPTDNMMIHDANGAWSYGGGWTCGPDGWPVSSSLWNDEWITDSMHGQLIGAVVPPGLNLNIDSPRALPQNDPSLFQIGTGPVALTGRSGVLWLGFNDDYAGAWNQTDNFGSVAVQVDSVPEPSTLALLGIGAIGLLAWACRRKWPA